MSRQVKISSIGDSLYPVPKGICNENAVDLMLDWLDKNLEKALCERPDIIVLPETVANPAGFRLKDNPGN